jgi:hypothetical protein
MESLNVIELYCYKFLKIRVQLLPLGATALITFHTI